MILDLKLTGKYWKHLVQDRQAVEKVGQYLVTVRAEHLFLITLLYTYMEDFQGCSYKRLPISAKT
jgi:hypothetical protein